VVCPFEDVKSRIQIGYTGEGSRIAKDFYLPLLKRTKDYSRASGYFSIESLVITAAGLAGLVKNGGNMRLVVGAHDFGPEIVKAVELSKSDAEGVLNRISEQIARGLETVESVFERRRLEALAWMIANGTLEIRVAIPKRTFHGRGNGIFHEKSILMKDADGCAVQAAGSANETRQAYEMNGENLTVHMSWRLGAKEYIEKAEIDFQALWEGGKHPDYYTFTLPEAIKKKLHERFYREQKPIEPLDVGSAGADIGRIGERCTALCRVAKMVSVLGQAEGLVHMGLGPVRLYPHQAFAADYTVQRFPHRILLADEVGLGKTLEAGAAIKRMITAKEIERVLILTPKNVTKQWMEEMWEHFRLHFYLLTTFPSKSLLDALGNVVPLSDGENPFSHPGIDLVVASWHYARKSEPKRMLLDATRGFDLVVVDEAHAARKKRSDTDTRAQPTKVNELCMELGISAPHMLLLTATPVQLRAIESHDLLRVLGLGGRWAVESEFESYFSALRKPPEDCSDDELQKCFKLASEFARSYLSEETWKKLAETTLGPDMAPAVVKAIRTGSGEQVALSVCLRRGRDKLHMLLMELSPVQWFMIRNTRSKLERSGFKFPKRIVEERNVMLSREHEELLAELDDYLHHHYAAYEKLIDPANRGTIGFVRSIYHQRFVSCFSAAHQTLTNRLGFISGLLNGDREALLRAAAKLLEDEELEEDEDDIVEATQELIGNREAEELLRIEEQKVIALLKKLEPYALGNITGSDPKLRAVLDEVRKLRNSQGRSILVFSKYVDTIHALKEFLLSHGFDQRQMAIYTGEGGQLPEGGKFVTVPKDKVQKALEEGKVSLVLCTDAAREGLNLQVASAIINVDMPWNPSSVEQRIGRVDRLGQDAPDVVVTNVWYPNSIEARMYHVLFERRQIYKLVIGPAQELFSNGLRKAFDESLRAERLDVLVQETFNRIDMVKGDLETAERVLSGRASEGNEGLDNRAVELVEKFVMKACDILGFKVQIRDGRLYVENVVLPEEVSQWNGASLVMGKQNALTPAHPIVQWLCEIVDENSGPAQECDRSIYLLKDENGVGTFYISDENGMSPCSTSDALEILAEYLEEPI
jgi:hypothetical protein